MPLAIIVWLLTNETGLVMDFGLYPTQQKKFFGHVDDHVTISFELVVKIKYCYFFLQLLLPSVG
jgi:hypothetical protein